MKKSSLNKEIQRGRGSWIVDRGSWIEDPKCPVLPGIRLLGERQRERERSNEG
jgi:hypothetical protein